MYQLLGGLLLPFATLIFLAIYGTVKKREKFIWKSAIIFIVYVMLTLLSGGALGSRGGLVFSLLIGIYGLSVIKRNDVETAEIIFSWVIIMAVLSIALLLVNPWGSYR